MIVVPNIMAITLNLSNVVCRQDFLKYFKKLLLFCFFWIYCKTKIYFIIIYVLADNLDFLYCKYDRLNIKRQLNYDHKTRVTSIMDSFVWKRTKKCYLLLDSQCPKSFQDKHFVIHFERPYHRHSKYLKRGALNFTSLSFQQLSMILVNVSVY